MPDMADIRAGSQTPTIAMETNQFGLGLSPRIGATQLPLFYHPAPQLPRTAWVPPGGTQRHPTAASYRPAAPQLPPSRRQVSGNLPPPITFDRPGRNAPQTQTPTRTPGGAGERQPSNTCRPIPAQPYRPAAVWLTRGYRPENASYRPEAAQLLTSYPPATAQLPRSYRAATALAPPAVPAALCYRTLLTTGFCKLPPSCTQLPPRWCRYQQLPPSYLPAAPSSWYSNSRRPVAQLPPSTSQLPPVTGQPPNWPSPASAIAQASHSPAARQ